MRICVTIYLCRRAQAFLLLEEGIWQITHLQHTCNTFATHLQHLATHHTTPSVGREVMDKDFTVQLQRESKGEGQRERGRALIRERESKREKERESERESERARGREREEPSPQTPHTHTCTHIHTPGWIRCEYAAFQSGKTHDSLYDQSRICI